MHVRARQIRAQGNTYCMQLFSERSDCMHVRRFVQLIVVTAHSSIGSTGATISPYMASLKGIASAGEPLEVAIYVDHSIVEVFDNSRIALTARAYPMRANSMGVLALATGQREEAKLSLQAWRTHRALEPLLRTRLLHGLLVASTAALHY